MMGGRVDQTTVPGVLRDHRARIRALEATPPSSSGWQFDTDNEGGWGYVQFNDPVDLDTLPDPMSIGGEAGGMIVDASGADDGLVLASTTKLILACLGDVLLAAAQGFHLNASDDSTVGVGVGTYGGSVAPGKTLTFTDHSGSPIFQLTG